MAINPPVDATQTPEWAALQKHYDELQSEGVSLKKWFADDAERVDKLSFDAGDLHFDLSKNLIKPETLQLFANLAKAVKLDERTKAMYSGVHINNTEDRAVLHTALRRPVEDEGKYIVDGQDTVKDVRETLDKIYAFADDVRSGKWTGVTGRKIETVVNTTLETLTNAREARTWLLEELAANGAIAEGDEAQKAEAIKKHFVAVSTNLEKVEEFGIDPNNAFGFWNWVGGRYSVDSAVGTSLAVVFGPARFEEFLHGFHEIDEYFANTPFEKNVVVLLGMLNVWYRNFFKVASHAVLPYDQYLHRFPAYLQQLLIPADFIAFVNTPNPTKDGDQDVHELFLGNYFAQTKALAFGKTADEVRAEGTPEEIVPARVFSGNRPTTSIFGVALTPFALGELIALYEHITFVEGTVWGLDSYDQWGVELGKQLAKQITPAISQDDEALAAQDASTQSLIKFYRANREF